METSKARFESLMRNTRTSIPQAVHHRIASPASTPPLPPPPPASAAHGAQFFSGSAAAQPSGSTTPGASWKWRRAASTEHRGPSLRDVRDEPTGLAARHVHRAARSNGNDQLLSYSVNRSRRSR
ncbi:hypothetical protein Sros01_43220 [Streptomyces roseochromogenus]|nr:hypothetical protein Sros01_43220 [Streptomyces roseochromogenus]